MCGRSYIDRKLKRKIKTSYVAGAKERAVVTTIERCTRTHTYIAIVEFASIRFVVAECVALHLSDVCMYASVLWRL